MLIIWPPRPYVISHVLAKAVGSPLFGIRDGAVGTLDFINFLRFNLLTGLTKPSLSLLIIFHCGIEMFSAEIWP